MVIHYPPARLRANSDQPTAITNVLLATSGSSSRTSDLPLGRPTCSSRSRRGRWALYPNGEEVIVVWPGGALAGPPVEVAASWTGWVTTKTTWTAPPSGRSGSS
jgi:hypothetical protein